MTYESRKKKISSFTVDDALTDSSTFDFIKNGINKKTSWGNILDKFSEVYGLGARIFETEADLIASDIQLGENAIVVSNNYGLYKITSLAAGDQDVTLTSGFVATLESALDVPNPADYTELRAIETAGLLDGTPITVTNSGIGGEGVLRNVTAHGLTDNGGTIIVINADWYWERSDRQGKYQKVAPFDPSKDGITNDALKISSAQNITGIVQLDSGSYGIESLLLNADARGVSGEGNRSTILNVTTPLPGYGITQTNDYSYLSDLRIQGSGLNLISAQSGSYFNTYQNVWFGPSETALTVSSDFYWTNFIGCNFRDNETAVKTTAGQSVNAITFLGGTLYHFNAAAAGPSLDLANSDGLCLMGVHVQNQGVKFDTMDGVEISGGYWECYDVATIDATNSSIHISGGVYFPNASLFKMDEASIGKLKGYAPNLVAKDSEGILYPDNSSQRTAPTQKSIKNLFDDGSCSTQKAIDALAYSPTGLAASRIINGSSNVEVSFSSTSHRCGFRIPSGNGISVFVKWRATAGTGRLSIQNTTDTMSLVHDSSVDSEWRYCHWHTLQSGSNPAIIFDPQSDTSTVIEIDSIIATDSYVALTADSSEYQLPSGKGTFASAGTAAVTFAQPPTGDYRIFLQGNANETFWYSSKTATGFTINSSNVTSTADVYWEIRLG